MFFSDDRKIMHRQVELSPVRKDWSVATISDEFLRKLSNIRIEIVPNIVHNTFSSFTSCWISLERIGFESIKRFKSIHVNVTILFEFFIKFFTELFMPLFREISEGISNTLSLLFFCQLWISFRCMGNILWSTILIGKTEISRGNWLWEVYF